MAEVDERIEASPEAPIISEHRQYGAFAGVFTPTLLTILGVIMYLRTGWVVGNAGLAGGLLIILLAFAITAATGLSMSSIVTNIRIGAGGAYSIITQSLGVEVGGSVGIPLYLSQALAVVMYIFGFREGWMWVFPEHPMLLVDVVVFGLIFGIAYISAGFAFRVQYVIMAVIAASLLSVATAAFTGSMQYSLEEVSFWGSFPGAPEDGFGGTSFWMVFAVFFPAATGVMAGANMSGELRDPRRSIPRGTLAAIGLSFVVYVLVAVWLARSATPEELVSNYTIMIDRAFWGPPVLAGLLGATFSSALASAVGAPRILQALADHDVLPGSAWMAERTESGEPRNAMMVTAVIVVAALLLRDLNAVAPLITMFFLITYLMINVVVFTEQTMGLVSFRPLLQIPRYVSFTGAVGCLFAMFIVNPTFSLVALVIVVAFYVLLARRSLQADVADVRSGLFVSLAEWAAKRTSDLPTNQERAWKPNLLVPVEYTDELRGAFQLIRDIAVPKGTVKLIGLSSQRSREGLGRRIGEMKAAFLKRGIYASHTVIKADAFADGLVAGVQALRGGFLTPNVLFLPLPRSEQRRADYREILREIQSEHIGLYLFAPHSRAGLGQQEYINIWISDRSPDWKVRMDIGNLDLPLLTGYKLKRNWNARMRVITVVEDPEQSDDARSFLKTLLDLARMPDAEVLVSSEPFDTYLNHVPQADLNIFGLQADPDFDFAEHVVQETHSSCLFVRDSGRESALA